MSNTRFATFEAYYPEDIDRDINNWLRDIDCIVENHSIAIRPESDRNNNEPNIIITIQYHMKGVNGAE